MAASRHAPPRRPIQLRVRAGHDNVRVDVIDEGPGIAHDVRPNLFKPFAPGGREAYGGVGLGLSIARAIVERHGGTLSAHDVPGGGARFTFSLRRCTE